jgi:peptidoglycan biosynthesis protein MviN/MurJ (putative lipid II flippase)
MNYLRNKLAEIWRRPNLKYILIIAFFLFFSKSLGFLRQALIFRTMDKVSSDLLFAGLTIPNAVTSFLISGTIVSSFLPVLARLQSKEKEETVSTYFSAVLITLLLGIGLLNIFGLVFTWDLLKLVTSHEVWSEFSRLGLLGDYVMVTRILLLGPLFFACQSVLGVFLNLKERFAIYSLAGVVANLFSIGGLLIAGRNGYIATAWGMMAGTFFTVIVYAFVAHKLGLRLKIMNLLNRQSGWWAKLAFDYVQTWKLFLPRILIINGTVLANFLVVRLAKNQGQITALDFGLSIQEIFFTVVVSASTVFFSDYARFINDDTTTKAQRWRKLRVYLAGVAGVAVAGSLITVVMAPVIMFVFQLLGPGQGAGQAEYIVLIARVSVLALVFQSLNEILAKYLHARERVWQPVWLSLLASAVQIGVVLALTGGQMDVALAVCLSLVAGSFTLTAGSYLVLRGDWKNERSENFKV